MDPFSTGVTLISLDCLRITEMFLLLFFFRCCYFCFLMFCFFISENNFRDFYFQLLKCWQSKVFNIFSKEIIHIDRKYRKYGFV